jgi:uncharacterized membrane-anchored protein
MSLPSRLRGWLEQETRIWTKEGLIGEAQRERLLARYPEVGETSGMAFALRSLGVIVLFAALMLVVSHNWEDLGRGGRMGTIVGLLVGLQVLALALRLRASEGASTLAHLAVGLGVGAAIFMTGQVYHLDAHAPDAVLAWCLAALPFVILLDWTILHVVHLVLCATWLGMKVSGNPPPGEGLELTFLALAAPSAWAGYRTPRAPLIGAVALAYAFLVLMLGVHCQSTPLALIVAPLALAALHAPGDRRADPWRAVGFVATAVLLLIIGDLENLVGRADFGRLSTIWRTAPLLSALSLAVVLLAAIRARRWKGGRRNDAWTAAGALALAEIWRHGTGHPAELSLVKAAANVGTLAMVASLLQLGLNEGRLRPYLAGAALFLGWLGWRYANVHEALGYLGMAAVFAVLGVALFVLARLWRARAERVEALPETALRPSWAETWLARIRPHGTALLIATYATQLGIVGWMVWHHGQPLREGRRFLVRCEPVDPRDLAKGDYVILGYPFSTVSRKDAEALAEDFWGAQAHPPADGRKALPADTVVHLPFTVGAGGLVKPGKLALAPPGEGPYLTGRWPSSRWNRTSRFGIEAFYVKEGTGKGYEQLMRTGLLLAEIAVLPDGRAGLVELKADPIPLVPVPSSRLEGWKPTGWGNWVISDAATFASKVERLEDGFQAPPPDFTRHRLVVLRGHGGLSGKEPVAEANEGLVRIRAGGEDRKGRPREDLMLLIPAGDTPVYGPLGRIDEAEAEE